MSDRLWPASTPSTCSRERGALGLEALSRGAQRATFLEQHFPTAKIVQENIATLGVEDRTEVAVGNVFVKSLWEARLSELPWLVFSSPPYEFYVTRREEMLGLLASLAQAAPAESIFVVEADERLDYSLLFDATRWDVRTYPPARIGIYHKPQGTSAPPPAAQGPRAE